MKVSQEHLNKSQVLYTITYVLYVMVYTYIRRTIRYIRSVNMYINLCKYVTYTARERCMSYIRTI